MLTTLATSAMGIAVTSQSADAFYTSKRDAFNNKYARKFYVRGYCKIEKTPFKKRGTASGRRAAGLTTVAESSTAESSPAVSDPDARRRLSEIDE